MTEINLLPWREQLREAHKREFYLMMGMSFVVALFILSVMHFVYASKIHSQEICNTMLTQEIASLDLKIREIQDLQKAKKALLARMTIIQELQSNRPQVVHLFDTLVDVLPRGIFLSHIVRKDNLVTLDGFSESNTNVSTLMRNVIASKWLEKPELQGIKTSDDPQVKHYNIFTLRMAVSNPAQIQEKK